MNEWVVMGEYTEYVLGVFGLATVVYGGLTLFWWLRLRRLQRQLQAEGGQTG